jgi:hypothetical protein
MQWQKTFGGTGTDYGLHVDQSADGGYILTGAFTTTTGNGADAYFVKTDASGNTLWNKTFGGPRSEAAWDVIQTSDGGYALACSTGSYGFGSGSTNVDAWIIKTDVEGGLAQVDSTANSVILYRGVTDAYWNFVRVRIWKTT